MDALMRTSPQLSNSTTPAFPLPTFQASNNAIVFKFVLLLQTFPCISRRLHDPSHTLEELIEGVRTGLEAIQRSGASCP
jgi:hypothetical protein